ncbi:hypothetical protein [Radicibacter daui]|uniref:hypothetical protein n=1 Tax=Radicibacter daui TaxID=3064829 RepID=UPI0040469070
MSRRIVISLLCVMLAAFCAAGAGDRALTVLGGAEPAVAGSTAVERMLRTALGVFATVRGIDAVVSAAQTASVSVGVGVSGSLEVGELLDPLNDVLEQAGSVLLTATVALGGERLLIDIGQEWGLKLLVPIGLLAAAVSVLLGGGSAAMVARRTAWAFLMLGLLGRFLVPLAFVGAEQLSHGVIQPQIEKAEADLRALHQEDSTLIPAPGADQGFFSTLSDMAAVREKLQHTVDALLSGADRIVESLVRLAAAYLFLIVLVPLGVLWLLGRATNAAMTALLSEPPPGWRRDSDDDEEEGARR